MWLEKLQTMGLEFVKGYSPVQNPRASIVGDESESDVGLLRLRTHRHGVPFHWIHEIRGTVRRSANHMESVLTTCIQTVIRKIKL